MDAHTSASPRLLCQPEPGDCSDMTTQSDSPADDSLVVIGNFDGVHQGHQAVLYAVCRYAKQRQLRPKLLTFQPHPAAVLGRRGPALLTTLERKIELVKRCCPGIEVVVQEFTAEFARQTPEEFVRNVLRNGLHTKVVMVGLNFHFGHRRSGNFGDLQQFGESCGFEAIAQPLVSDPRGPWSSTRVRGLIAEGNMAGATEILGRCHMLSGVVVHGDERGRLLGFPTCNLDEVPEALPPYGVYAVLVDELDEATGQPRALAKGVANIGVRPTVHDDKRRPSVEVHLFDLDRSLYGARLRVHLVEWLRAERRFSGFEALKAQIRADSAHAREALADCEPDESLDGAWA